MRIVLLAAVLAAHGAQAASAAPRAAEDWLVLLRWQATPPATAGADRQWTTASAAPPAAASADWPALRLRAGSSASWRQDRWHTDSDSTTGWTPQGPVLYAAERRSPDVQSLTLQALPTRRSDALNLAWTVTWPRPDGAGGSQAQGSLMLAPGRWVTVAEWAPPAPFAPVASGDRAWSTTRAADAGWRLQVRAEHP